MDDFDAEDEVSQVGQVGQVGAARMLRADSTQSTTSSGSDVLSPSGTPKTNYFGRQPTSPSAAAPSRGLQRPQSRDMREAFNSQSSGLGSDSRKKFDAQDAPDSPLHLPSPDSDVFVGGASAASALLRPKSVSPQPGMLPSLSVDTSRGSPSKLTSRTPDGISTRQMHGPSDDGIRGQSTGGRRNFDGAEEDDPGGRPNRGWQ